MQASAASRASAMELVAIWIDPELEELSEVACCLLYFILQYFLCQDFISGIDQGTQPCSSKVKRFHRCNRLSG